MGMQKLASSVSKIRKSQNLLLYSLMAGMTIVILALTAALFAGSSTIRKPQPKSYKAPITSGSSRMDPKEVYVEKLTTDHEIQGKRLDAVEKMLETLIKINDGAGKVPQRIEQTMIMPGYPQHPQQSSPSLTGTDPKYQHISMTGHPVAEVRGDLQAVLGDEGHPSQDFITSSSNQSNPHAKGTGAPLKQEKTPRFRSKGIQRTSLMLANSKSNKNLKTADNTIPAGAFAGAVMVGGVDASTSIQASNDPRPVLLRVTDHGTLPRKFKSDLSLSSRSSF